MHLRAPNLSIAKCFLEACLRGQVVPVYAVCEQQNVPISRGVTPERSRFQPERRAYLSAVEGISLRPRCKLRRHLRRMRLPILSIQRTMNCALDRIGREQFSPQQQATCASFFRLPPA